MKNVFYLLLLLCFSKLSAQNEFLNKNNSLAPVGGINMGVPSSSPSVYTPNVFNKNKPSSAPKSTIPEKETDMKMEEFANSSEKYVKKFNEKIEKDIAELTLDRPSFRRDMDMGTFQTTSQYVIVYSRDHSEIDGDWVKAWHNEVVINPAILLNEFYDRGLRVDLQKGKNVIAMEAMNTGLGFPNTAQFMVKDDKGNIITSDMWALDTGFKAIINIEKR